MKKKTLIIIVLALVVAAAVVVYFVFKRRNNNNNNNNPDNSNSTGGGTTGTNSGFPLKYGSRGENVKKLQRRLNEQLPSTTPQLVVDGIWGKKTEDAVKLVYGINVISESKFNDILNTSSLFEMEQLAATLINTPLPSDNTFFYYP